MATQQEQQTQRVGASGQSHRDRLAPSGRGNGRGKQMSKLGGRDDRHMPGNAFPLLMICHLLNLRLARVSLPRRPKWQVYRRSDLRLHCVEVIGECTSRHGSSIMMPSLTHARLGVCGMTCRSRCRIMSIWQRLSSSCSVWAVSDNCGHSIQSEHLDPPRDARGGG